MSDLFGEMMRHEGEGVARGGGGRAGAQGRAHEDLNLPPVRVPRYRLVRWLSVLFWLAVWIAIAAAWWWVACGGV